MSLNLEFVLSFVLASRFGGNALPEHLVLGHTETSTSSVRTSSQNKSTYSTRDRRPVR
jgi:hypothetical protein